MKKLINEIKGSAKELLENVYSLCRTMDKKDYGTQKWVPGKKSEEVFKLSLYTFFLYIASADGKISREEAGFINDIMDTRYTVSEYQDLSETAKVNQDHFETDVPVPFRASVEIDNRIGEKPEISKLMLKTYAFLGFGCMICDEHATQSEYDRIQTYLKMIYDFLEEELDNRGDLTEPRYIIQELLDNLSASAGYDKGSQFIEPDRPGTGKKKSSGPKKKDGEKSLEELLNDLNSLIGLEEVKYDVTSLINLVRIRDIREKMGLEMPPISLHLVFSGNPGTGKTTVARLLAEIYHKIGILSKGQLVEVDRSGMVAGYVGQTALKVQDVIKQALGGVLFIDEAYALTPENPSNDYGLEAIDTLVKNMEDHRDDLIVIVAGYTEPMERFIRANPGLKSRFNKFIHFRDYTPQELTKIFQLFCSQNKYRPSRPALNYVLTHFQERIDEKPEDFANAREARNLFEFAVAHQANRIITETSPTEDLMTLIRKEDVAGMTKDIGKEQFLVENALAGLKGKRQGIPKELLSVHLDELELPARCCHILTANRLVTVEDILNYLDQGKELSEIPNLSQRNIDELKAGLKQLGWEAAPL